MDHKPTDEQIAAYAAGELDYEAAGRIKKMLEESETARRLLDDIRAADAALAELKPVSPPDESVLRARRALFREMREVSLQPEIMTFGEAAEYLKVSVSELETVMDELPVFEIGGQIRIRREKLLEWIDERERQSRSRMIDGDVGRIISGISWKGAVG